MVASDQPPTAEQAAELPPPTTWGEQFLPLIRTFVALTIITGVLFPLFLWGVAQLNRFPANGSLIERDENAVGSELIPQAFTNPAYFHPRPSAAGTGYDPLASGGTNLAPTNPKYRAEIQELAMRYRRENGLTDEVPVPMDAVTRSGSGLDPHITPENARLQLARVAVARKASEETIERLIKEHTRGRQFGLLGEPRVNVLTLNLALDRTIPLPK